MTVVDFKDKSPKIDASAYISPRCFISGDVEIREMTGVFDFASIRGDLQPIRIGRHTSIQDSCTIHCGSFPCEIGSYVTAGHNAVIHGAKVGDYAVIGFGSCILDRAVIEDNSIVGAGAVVTSGTVVESGALYVGSPAKMVKKLDDNALKSIRMGAETYTKLSMEYKSMFEGGGSGGSRKGV